MKEIVLHIDKKAVYEEVAQTTSYTGAKMKEDADAYDRIFTTDEDRDQLERFWNESCADACEQLKQFLEEETNNADGFTINLSLSSSFNEALTGTMEKELFSFFVMNIAGKWYAFTNKDEAGDYVAGAATMLEGVHRKACYKQRPQRPRYDS